MEETVVEQVREGERWEVTAAEFWDAMRERSRSGKHTVVRSPGPLPAAPRDLHVLLVDCAAPDMPGGVLEAARHKVEQLLGETLLPAEQFEIGLRHRFLGDVPVHPVDAVLVEECNRLAARTERDVILVFETIDAADEPTLATLTQILQRPGWLRLPLLFTLRGTPQGRVTELVTLLRREEATQAVMEIAGNTPSHELAGAFAWTALPPDVLRVLRAGAVLGTSFDAEIIAQLLDIPLATVLEKLQVAADAGVPLIDRGERRFALPATAIEQLQGGMLPSLLTFWHARLGALFSGGHAAEDTAVVPEPHRTEATDRAMPHSVSKSMVAWPEELFEVSTPHAAAAASRPPRRDAAVSTPAWRAEPPRAEPAPGVAARVQTREPQRTEGRTDMTRAAAHLQAAGQTEAAVARYLAAVREVAACGDAQRAYGLAKEAFKLLDKLPTSPPRALLRGQLLIEIGRLQWHSALLGTSFTLRDALVPLKAARSCLPSEVPPDVAGDLAAVTAGVCYDLGDLDALQQALADLTEVSRSLLDAGQPLMAARLLNDQAAVTLRLGDPVQAAYLLSQSRELFEHRVRDNPDDAVAIEELAETQHLFARLPLHAQIRPGREEEAYAMGLDHAQAAERAYQRLGQRDKLARVWETRGRLELRRQRLEAAHQALAAAIEIQQQLGDVIGLARSTAALAELCMTTGRLGDAAALLANAIALNVEKGSPIGLAFNRRTFELLSGTAAQAHGTGSESLHSAMSEVERRLVEAETMLGRLPLPGEAP
jgi:tetratricopeptide (TPR) repeat protein